MARACCSSVLTATKRMVGRLAASAIASASAASFFWRLTNGLTYAGGIKRTSCPASRIARPQWWALPQASMATMQRGRSAKKPRTFSRVSFFHECPLRCVGCDKHRGLGTLRCRQEGASTPSAPLRIAAHVRDSLLSNLGGEHRAKPVPPEPDGLVADVDPALGQQILDIAQRQRVSHVHHHDRRMTSGELLKYRNGLLMRRG